jgi:hypothetical protein
MPVTPTLRRLKQEDFEFETSCYTARSCLRKPKTENNKTTSLLAVSKYLTCSYYQ